MPITIHPIANHPEFVPTVAAWYKSYWGPRFPGLTQKDWENTIAINQNQLPFTIIAIDTDTNTPVGTATLKLCGMGNYKADKSWLSSLYVVPEYRGKKIATQLIVSIEAVAQKKFPEIYLYTKTDGRIYKQLGWVEIDSVELQGQSFRVMKKPLTLLYNCNRLFSNHSHQSTSEEKSTLVSKL